MAQYKIIIADTIKYKEIVDKLKRRNDLIMASIITKSKLIEVGDMFWVRDELIEMGYVLWQDFAIKKIE